MRILSAFAPAALAAAALLPPAAAAQGKLTKYLNSLPKQTVSTAERDQLLLMRQEEKLARDVYQVLGLVWNIPVFSNIAQSEQNHMDLVLWALQRYGIQDPLPSNHWGVYKDPAFTTLFVALLQFGINSPQHALAVGAYIEDLDIVDLNHALKVTDNRDIDTVWQNLQQGSRNHLRSFYKLLASYSLYYPGFVMTYQEVQAIVTSSMESGPVDENGNAL